MKACRIFGDHSFIGLVDVRNSHTVHFKNTFSKLCEWKIDMSGNKTLAGSPVELFTLEKVAKDGSDFAVWERDNNVMVVIANLHGLIEAVYFGEPH
jgi:hypothetical protein